MKALKVNQFKIDCILYHALILPPNSTPKIGKFAQDSVYHHLVAVLSC